jgi:hypothetical protein
MKETECLHLKSEIHLNNVGFEVLTAVVMKRSIFWDITPGSLLKANRRFGGTVPSRVKAGSKQSSAC